MPYNFSQLKTDLAKIEERLGKEYMQIHTGRASPTLLDSIMIESYGAQTPIKNIASVNIEDPKTLRVVPWDKAHNKEIEKAIIASNIGLSVAPDDQGLRIIFPQLTTETRQKLVKVLKERLEEARIAMRKERDTAWNAIQGLERDGKMSEDDKFRAKEELQKHIDEANATLEQNFAKKEHEVMN